MERRKFLGSACKLCLLAGAGFLISDLTACTTSSKVLKLPVVKDTVRLSLTGFSNQPMQILRPDGWLYDIAVRKISGDQYEAMLLECTHLQNQLMVNPTGFKCTLHGSQFDLDGHVVKGPAELPLKRYATSVDQGQLIIQLKS